MFRISDQDRAALKLVRDNVTTSPEGKRWMERARVEISAKLIDDLLALPQWGPMWKPETEDKPQKEDFAQAQAVISLLPPAMFGWLAAVCRMTVAPCWCGAHKPDSVCDKTK